MEALTFRNRISIAEICFYSPALAGSLYLLLRHGPGRNAAWNFLVLFSAIRLCGAALQLETIAQPFSIPIYTGSMILQSVGISPLMLAALALLGRLLGPIRRVGLNPVLKPAMLTVIRLLTTLGLVLGIAGGVKAGREFSTTGKFVVSAENKCGLGFICAAYGLLVCATAAMSRYSTHVAQGEKRLLLAVWLSLPFILIRVMYGALSVFYTKDEIFNVLEGDANYFLGMAVITEIVVVVIYLTIGSTTRSMPWEEQRDTLGIYLDIAGPLVHGRCIASSSHGRKERDIERGSL